MKEFSTKNVPLKTRVLYSHDGEQLSEDSDKFYLASTIIREDEEEISLRYFIRVYGGAAYDPLGPFKHREDQIKESLGTKEVSKDTFDLYLAYLVTKNSLYLTRTNRNLLND